MDNKQSIRLSNMELLRIASMFLVLVVHANFFSLGWVLKDDLMHAPIDASLRLFFQSISIVCVNVFILLSGWFGIRPRLKSFLGFIFQCYFFVFSIYICSIILGISDLSISALKNCILLKDANVSWFVYSYIFLYLLSPILNTYINNTTDKQLLKFVVLFFLFQTFLGWMFNSASFFSNGYSPISFIGLYMLARLISRKEIHISAGTCICIYFLISIIITIIAAALCWLDCNIGFLLLDKLYSYINPLVIASSVFLLLFFSKIHFKSLFINSHPLKSV